MANAAFAERRTSADVVFQHLYDEIISLGLMPGSKMSEADVADQFGISRQPVRDAFNRLGNLGLLQIQPQRATLVQKFSVDAINSARFVRLAIELEAAREACAKWSDSHTDRFLENIGEQEDAVKDGDFRRFHALDEAFHHLMFKVAEREDSFMIVLQKKALADRICVLSLKQPDEMTVLIDDHRSIFESLRQRSQDQLDAALRQHLSRIAKTISTVRQSHAEYFVE